MATVDSLEIKIDAEAKTASNAIDNLIAKLDRLTTSLSKINGSSLTGLANGVQRLGNAMQAMNNVRTEDFEKIASGFERFAKIDASKLYATSSALNNFSKGIESIGNVTFNAEGLNNLASAVSKFGRKISTQATENLPTISAQLQNFVRQLNNIGSLNFDTTNLSNLINAISKLGGKSVTNAIANIPQLAIALNNLMSTLSRSPQVSQNIIQMTNALANLASQGNRVSSASNNLTNGLNRSGFAMGTAAKSSKNLALSLGKLVIKWRLALQAAKKLWSSIKSSMNYIEVLNYFDAAFTQVAEKADLSSFREMGYASAEEYANSFAERAKELTSKMTGFEISPTGTLEATGIPSLGLDPSELMNYQAMFAQMSSSMGVASETAVKLSGALSMIGADLASVKNLEFEDVWEDMASGLAGMSRTLDKYGVNIRNVNLQQKLTELGIDANITALNQNNKALLRTIILLDSTRYAWGDLADTINQPANQLRLIESNFQNLARTIGNLFLPMVQKVLPYINGLVIALQRLFLWVGSILGLDLSKVTSSIGNTDFSNLIDGTEDLTDGLDSASKAANKLKTATLGIDELNINAPQEEGTGTGAGGGLTSGLLDAAFEDALSKYQKAWDEAFANMENRAQEFADRISKFLQPLKNMFEDLSYGIRFDDNAWFETAGRDLGEFFDNILTGIDNFLIRVDESDVGSHIAAFLNGLISPDLFGHTGRTLAQSLNSLAKIFNDFGIEFKWENLGISLSTGFKKFIENWDAGLTAETLSNFAKGILEVATAAIIELGDNNSFETLGQKIVDFICGIDWIGLAWDLTKFFAALADSMSEFPSDFAKGIAEGILSKITGEDVKIETPKWFDNFQEYIFLAPMPQFSILKILPKSDEELQDFSQKISTLKERLREILSNPMEDISDTGLAVGLVGPFTATQILVEENLDKIKEKVDEFKENISRKWDGIETWFDESIKLWFTTDKWSELWENAKSAFSTKWEEIVDWWKNTAIYSWWEDDVKPFFSDEYWSELWENVKTSFSDAWNSISEWWKESALYLWWTEDVEPWFALEKWQELLNNVKTSFSTKWTETSTEWTENITKWWNTNVTPWFTKEKWEKMLSKIPEVFKNTFKNAANGAIGFLNNVISGVEEMVNNAIKALVDMASSLNKIPGVNIQFETPHITLPRIPQYKVGGFPEDGLFMANHNELIGKFSNGKTAVANNEMIVAGIEEAAYRGFVRANAENTVQESLLRELIDAVREGKEISIDGRSLVAAYDERKLRNGYNFV